MHACTASNLDSYFVHKALGSTTIAGRKVSNIHRAAHHVHHLWRVISGVDGIIYSKSRYPGRFVHIHAGHIWSPIQEYHPLDSPKSPGHQPWVLLSFQARWATRWMANRAAHQEEGDGSAGTSAVHAQGASAETSVTHTRAFPLCLNEANTPREPQEWCYRHYNKNNESNGNVQTTVGVG